MMTSEAKEFEFPHLFLGCQVEVSGDPAWTDKSFGVVARVKGGSANSADIIVYHKTGPTYMRRDCWHEDDPRVVTLAQVFQDGDRGVFRLAEGEIRSRQLTARLGGLEALLEKLVEDVELLKRVNPPPRDVPETKRKRRVPPARQPETAGV